MQAKLAISMTAPTTRPWSRLKTYRELFELTYDAGHEVCHRLLDDWQQMRS